jgi:hypothetical protein
MYRTHSFTSDDGPPEDELPRPATEPPARKTAHFQTGLKVCSFRKFEECYSNRLDLGPLGAIQKSTWHRQRIVRKRDRRQRRRVDRGLVQLSSIHREDRRPEHAGTRPGR